MSNALVIRADANTQMGTGHVMRCIALGQAWQDAGGRVVFVSCCDAEPIKQRIRDEGFELINLDQAWPVGNDDLKRTINAAEDDGAKWIVSDGYHFDLEYQRAIRRAGFQLLCVDDYNHLPQYEADILLNQNVGSDQFEYRSNPESQQLLGIRYVMLRREFRNLPAMGCDEEDEKEIKSPPNELNVLVTMGGSDPDNASVQIIHALDALGISNLRVRLLVGPSNPHAESLGQALATLSIDCELMCSVRDMPGLIQWADFAITAAGSTCWELAAMNVPFAIVILAENQKRIAQWLEQQAGIPMLGWVDAEFGARCTTILSHCLSIDKVDPSRQMAIPMVDYFGTDRVLRQVAADCGLDILKNRLALRPVFEDDSELLLDWANDPATRRNSFNSEPIRMANHIAWLNGRLENPQVRMFILEIDSMPCGHIRYELDEKGDAVLSFVVSPAFRGMGIGQKLVELSRPQIAATWVGCRIKALTLSENKASSRIFVKTGFIPQKTDPIHGKECNVYYWSNLNNEG